MKIIFHIRLVVIILFLCVYQNTYCHYFFISKEDIRVMKIQEIKKLYKNYCYRDSLDCYISFQFDEGKLTREISFDGFKGDIDDALDLAYVYLYKKDSFDELEFRIGDAYNGPSRQDHLITYYYEDGKLKYEQYKQGILFEDFYGRDTITTFWYEIIYNYHKNGKVNYYIPKSSKGMGLPIYYLYNVAGDLIGYFPAKNEEMDDLLQTDTIYYTNKIQELKEIGFEKFSKKYLHGEILKKVIEDCYVPIRNEQLLINGKSIKEFLANIGKTDVQYVIFEVADNYFLFYKIID